MKPKVIKKTLSTKEESSRVNYLLIKHIFIRLNMFIQHSKFNMCFNNTIFLMLLHYYYWLECCYSWDFLVVDNDLMLFMLLITTPYSFGHMVEGKFQISKFLSRFGLAYDIISQMKVLTHALTTPCWCSCVSKIATLLLLSRMMLLFLRCWKWFDIFVFLIVEPYCFGHMVEDNFKFQSFLPNFSLFMP
jgi:hypothetical protein